MEKRIMGLDYGEARTGVSVSDLLGITAQGVVSINHKSDKELLTKLKAYIDEYKPYKIIIGLPKNMNGTEGPRVQKTKSFIEKLNKAFNIPVETLDERLTTVSSYRTMQELKTKKDKKKAIVDMMSAVFILQTYIDKSKNL